MWNCLYLLKRGVLVYMHHAGRVEVATKGTTLDDIAEAETVVRKAIGKHIYGIDGQTIAQAVVERLIAIGETVAVAESCTGGLLGHQITNVPGASAVFAGGVLSYSNAMKEKLLGVNASILSKDGAVSKSVAIEMAEGVLEASCADHALSITGIAGPTGGSPEKPVGTVWFGLASKGCRSIAIRKFRHGSKTINCSAFARRRGRRRI